MCIAVFIWQAHPLYPLLLLFNRDEYHNRKCKLGFLTNVMEPPPNPKRKTRGELIVRFLESSKSPVEFVNELIAEVDRYNGFNLVLADISSRIIVYVSNRPIGVHKSVQVVSPGIHAERLNQNFQEVLRRHSDGAKGEVRLEEMMKKLMRDDAKAEKSRLPGVWYPEYEMEASSIFVEFDTPKGRCGTRSTAALSVTTMEEVTIYEEYLDQETWKVQKLV
ncbi:hypothetical protein MKX03_014649 [Papaver bracteatum]|nr:hypothetical protein MKX03_014649 [Papaver bracteatum]